MSTTVKGAVGPGAALDGRTRILKAIAHEETDRVPLDLGSTDTTIAAEVCAGLAELLGLRSEAAHAAPHPDAHVTPDESILEALGIDVRLAPTPRPAPPGRTEVSSPDGAVEWTYPDGRVMRRPAGAWDVQLARPAITGALTREEIERVLPLPPAEEEEDWADAQAIRTTIAKHHAAGHAVQCEFCILPVTITSNGPLDFTAWCTELAAQPDLLCELMDRQVETLFAWAESFYTAVGPHADLVYALGDDVASHTGMWMAPEDYRRYVKPRHARIVEFVRARTDAKIVHHCCGAARPILGDLVDIGVDIFNPTQTSAAGMDPFELKREFGRDITFWGGIDVIDLLPNGTVRDVEDAVKRHIDALAPGGGYVLSPSHMVPRGTPPENVFALYRTAIEYAAV